MDLKVQLSSCVPSSHMETAGACIEAADLAALMGHSSGLGLAEMMNYPGVLAGDPGLIAKLQLFAGGHIDGHCPQLSGLGLNGYTAAGIRTEHEATTAHEAREKLQKGLRVLIREGSVSKDLHALAPLLTERTSPYMCLCTDDRNPLDIAEEGRVVHATGLAGLLALSHGRGRGFGSGVKGQSALFDAPGLATLPQLFIETLHVIAHADGTVALGSTSENTYEDTTRTDAQLDALIDDQTLTRA